MLWWEDVSPTVLRNYAVSFTIITPRLWPSPSSSEKKRKQREQTLKKKNRPQQRQITIITEMGRARCARCRSCPPALGRARMAGIHPGMRSCRGTERRREAGPVLPAGGRGMCLSPACTTRSLWDPGESAGPGFLPEQEQGRCAPSPRPHSAPSAVARAKPSGKTRQQKHRSEPSLIPRREHSAADICQAASHSTSHRQQRICPLRFSSHWAAAAPL